MRILMTGATGFVGRHLLERMLEAGHDVHVVARPNSKLPRIVQDRKTVGVYRHDGQTDSLCQFLQSLKPDLVVHLASHFAAQHTTADIQELVASNILFGTQLVEAMTRADVKWLVNTGTSWQHYENAEYRPVCLYAATKQAFEDVLRFYVDTGKLHVIHLKLYDTFGPNDPRGKLISFLLERATRHDGQAEPLAMSPGEQWIDIVYIDDVVEAYMMAMQRLAKNTAREETYAVSSGKPMRLRDLVAEFEIVTGRTLPIQWGERPYREREVMRPWSGGRPIPGWVPRVSFEEGIRRIVRDAG